MASPFIIPFIQSVFISVHLPAAMSAALPSWLNFSSSKSQATLFSLTIAFALALPVHAADALSPTALQQKLLELTPRLVASTVSIQAGGASGSGVIVTPDGLILTAAHVTSQPGAKLRILLADGRDLEGTALGVDHTTDAGIARIVSPGPFPYQPYVKDATYAVGDWVIATGHPGGPHAYRPSPVRLGQINQAGTKGGFEEPITTTAMVISGDSGGPLFDLEGRVIGINSNISGDWNTNNHVPLPSFIPVWQQLMNSEKIEGVESERAEPNIDDPYKAQREFFYRELAKRPNDPAANLLKQPELLDPHHIQEHLNRWARESVRSASSRPSNIQTHLNRSARESTGDTPFDPLGYPTTIPFDKQPALRPYLGLQLDGSRESAVIASITTDSPAADSLQIGDVITSLNDIDIRSVAQFARVLDELEFNPENPNAIILTILRDGEELLVPITPKSTLQRLYFRQPLSALTDRMMSRAPAMTLSDSLQNIRNIFIAQLPKDSPSVIPLVIGSQQIVLATALSANGMLLTKTSEITNADGTLIDGITAKIDGESLPIDLLKSDSLTDLSLVKVNTSALSPAQWTPPGNLATASIVITPLPNESPAIGITTQTMRSAPKSGFDHLLTLGKTPPFLGITLATFSINPDHPTISLVEAGSPAESAGLLEGDLIVSVEGEEIASAQNITEILGKKQPGERVDITVKRGQQDVDLKAILGKRTINSNRPSPEATRTDQALSQLSASGGTLSKRRQGFPMAIYHDTPLIAPQCGGPILNLRGQVIGINISRSLRQRSLALPSTTIRQALIRMK